MLVIAALGGEAVTLAKIRECAQRGGWRVSSKENISAHLNSLKGLIIKTNEGWELTDRGKQLLTDKGVNLCAPPTAKVAQELRSMLDRIQNIDAKAYAEEAVQCLEYNLLRSAVVMSWIGALHILYDFVVSNKLQQFNAEERSKNIKWKDVETIDELAKTMKESAFLDKLESMRFVNNSQKKELLECLNRRNSCGHPNSYRIRSSTVVHHLEVLLANVYVPFL